MRILHLEPNQIAASVRTKLNSLGTVDYITCESQEELRAQLVRASYDAVFVRLGLGFRDEEFDLCPDLKAVVTPTTGLDHIGLDVARTRNIEVLSLKGEVELLEKISSTAELTWTLLLALVRKLPFAFNSVLENQWNKWLFEGEELIEKTLGIVGCGRLGRMVARYGLAFGMNVIGMDSDPKARELAGDGIDFTELEDLLIRADVVSLHVPLNESTAGFFNRDCFEKMKNGAYFINTARGELTDQEALLDALASNLAGAAVDVIQGDSCWDHGVPEGHPLVEYAGKNTNLILTPHVGGCSITATHRSRKHSVDMFCDFLRNRKVA